VQDLESSIASMLPGMAALTVLAGYISVATAVDQGWHDPNQRDFNSVLALKENPAELAAFARQFSGDDTPTLEPTTLSPSSMPSTSPTPGRETPRPTWKPSTFPTPRPSRQIGPAPVVPESNRKFVMGLTHANMAALNAAAERQYAWSRREEQLRELQELQEKVYEQAAVVRHSMSPETARKTDPNLSDSISSYFAAQAGPNIKGKKARSTSPPATKTSRPTSPPTTKITIKATHKTYSSSGNLRRTNYRERKAEIAASKNVAAVQESSAKMRSMIMQVARERSIEATKRKSMSRSRWWWRKWHASGSTVKDSKVKDAFEVRNIQKICFLVNISE
jgi:hypothetical protein